MESGGISRIVPGSQEVIGSTPICSTLNFKGLQIFQFVIPFFLAVFCQPDYDDLEKSHRDSSSFLTKSF